MFISAIADLIVIRNMRETHRQPPLLFPPNSKHFLLIKLSKSSEFYRWEITVVLCVLRIAWIRTSIQSRFRAIATNSWTVVMHNHFARDMKKKTIAQLIPDRIISCISNAHNNSYFYQPKVKHKTLNWTSSLIIGPLPHHCMQTPVCCPWMAGVVLRSLVTQTQYNEFECQRSFSISNTVVVFDVRARGPLLC